MMNTSSAEEGVAPGLSLLSFQTATRKDFCIHVET